MLTVTIKNQNNREEVYECQSVAFQDVPKSDSSEENIERGLYLNFADGTSTVFGLNNTSSNFKDAFVMNSDGKTVARYKF